MALAASHAHSGLDLPIGLEMGAAILGVGFVVLVVIAYDIYRQHWLKG